MSTALARADGFEADAMATASTQETAVLRPAAAGLSSGLDGTNVVWLISLDKSDGQRVTLAPPLRVSLSIDPDDGGRLAFAPYVRCCGAGEDFGAALDDLAGDILAMRDELNSQPDANLADDAHELKQRLLRLIP